MSCILVIEDDPGVQEALVALLRDEGYEVEVAVDGDEALRRLGNAPLPSLILLDLMMPKMDGVEFRRRQLADARLERIPVIVISARTDVAAQARALGAADFMAKPMHFEELLFAVQNRAITVVTALPDDVPRTLQQAWDMLHQ
jgi:CheY-like chemotaxis protein